jgi:hypothetical protein
MCEELQRIKKAEEDILSYKEYEAFIETRCEDIFQKMGIEEKASLEQKINELLSKHKVPFRQYYYKSTRNELICKKYHLPSFDNFYQKSMSA